MTQIKTKKKEPSKKEPSKKEPSKKDPSKKEPRQKKTYKQIKLQSIHLKPSFNLNININNNDDDFNYKSVFSNNKKINKDIIFLKKKSFEIFYSNKYKYPLLVSENITKQTGKGNTIIKRSEIQDKWELDTTIETKNTLTFDRDYDIYEYYGGSAGHNAPAFNHKFNINDYHETFLISNITPQNLILNMGIWALLENWCTFLQYNNKLKNIYVFTGSIPNTEPSILYNAKLEKSILNIPIKMFKIVCFNHNDYPDITFIEIFIFNNKNNLISIDKSLYNFTKYILPIKSYNWFENTTGINISHLLKYYKLNFNTIKSFKNIINLNIKVSTKLTILLYKSYIFNLIIASNTLKELYNNWNEFKLKYADILKEEYSKMIVFLEIYFYKCRNRIIREKILYTNTKTLKDFEVFFNDFKNDLNNNYKIDETKEFNILDGISQNEYLNMYYNKIKKELKK
jgi:DNA/RNA endonuclease G (NUC1)